MTIVNLSGAGAFKKVIEMIGCKGSAEEKDGVTSHKNVDKEQVCSRQSSHCL